MENTVLKERLEQVEKELVPYKDIIYKLFTNPLLGDELKQFMTDNQEDISKLQKLFKERTDILWILTPPEEKQKFIDKYSD
jgi:hypothetical protein